MITIENIFGMKQLTAVVNESSNDDAGNDCDDDDDDNESANPLFLGSFC